MNNSLNFYIDGAWVSPATPATLEVINPATEEAYAEISLGAEADVNRAVAAARAAFPGWAETPVADRIAAAKRLLAVYNARYEDMAQAISAEMGAPITWAREAQAYAGQGHLEAAITAAENFEWESQRGTTRILREAIGVCALITPWNWPMNQIMCKVAPAILAGCTVVLKPSEIAPMSGLLFAEFMDEAGFPNGVFNLVNGTGPDVGQVMSGHPDVDMVSFTGSTRAGIIVARTAAETVKRVAQELGGKSPNIILPDADFEKAVTEGTLAVMNNTGQSCDAPTRMLVSAERMQDAMEIARAAAETVVVGDPTDEATTMGPLVSALQFEKVQRLIETGIAEGATLATGGPGKPEGRNTGFFVKPTVFGDVTGSMTIAREEIFGPVLSILAYSSVEEAIEIANDTVYGLAAYLQGSDPDQIRALSRKLRAGSVYVNGPDWDLFAPFGGYKQSGNGREYADWGLHDFTEIKGVVGWG
ncbi:aldehyde dehydrogenase family protein [Thalassovita mangrovi]|uniref:Aldehyde dehydrogenase family protein n=1 Tax=Thalassovita mangrovi TaxID=2692236 RepID=A0A6L8LKA1_9RHOB|nr:aldehyde dehydrogenase family protein [Thalassovita mangrovi]MYM56384.1 aldehyde dehydrogenase family protein [Thalassovita mangrovi]